MNKYVNTSNRMFLKDTRREIKLQNELIHAWCEYLIKSLEVLQKK